MSGSVARDPTDSDEGEDSCRNSEGAKSLGWILCPVLSFLGSASEKVYNDYVEPALQVDAGLFGDKSQVVDAWETFRNIANIIFIILLLVVIFSQLTGVGIDNYGIKKIMPRLIVAAIMINLSYLICVLLVDVSNIVGNGFQAIFNGLGSSLHPSVDLSAEQGTLTQSIDFTGPLVSVGVLAALVVMGGMIWANPSILLSLLVGAISIVVSIFFLFLLLAAREAAIIVLIVLSPIAVVLYMLPNTKKLFDKWLKFFQGLLLVYPIAGLLVGGGNYVSKLLMSMPDKGFFSTLIGMVIGIIPIFFIPMVLKNSFSAMGKVGGMLAGLGDSAKKRATGAVRGTEAFKNAQKMGLERRTRLRSGLDRDGNLTARGKRRVKALNKLANVPIIGGAARGAAKNQAALMAQAKKDISASEAAMGTMSGALARSEISKAKPVDLKDGGGALTQEGNYYAGNFMDAASRGDITGMNAAIEAMRNSNMKAKDISRVIRSAQNNGRFKDLDKDKKSAWFRDLSKKYGNDFLSTDYELNHFMRTGGSLNNGELGEYGQYAKNAPIEPDEIRPEDITKLSGDSLAAMTAAGKISSGMAQRIMESNPNISEDKKIMLGAVAEGKIGNLDTSNSSIKAFKDDARSLMAGGQATNKTFNGASHDDVMRWSAATPQAVRVVNGGASGGGNSGASGGGNSGGVDISNGSVSGASSGSGGTGGAGGTGGSGGSGGSGQPAAYDFTGMSDESVLDMATAPNVAMNNPVREAAEREYNRRTQPQPQVPVQGSAARSSQPQLVVPQQTASGENRTIITGSTSNFNAARQNPQPSSILGDAPKTVGTDIVLPGTVTNISSAAEEASRNSASNNNSSGRGTGSGIIQT